MAAKDKPNEIYLTRVYDAPVKAVWDAWTDPKKAAMWWGPRGFTITTHSKDLKPGGHWSYTMHGPDGVDWPNRTTYHEVEKYSRLVYDHGANETQPALFRVTVDFTESNGKTTMEMVMTLATPEAAAETRKFVKKAGGNSTWDRLGEYLEHESSGAEKFIINRSFGVPIDTMFEMWSKPEHVANWMPPTGMTMQFLKADIQVGGSTFFVMEGHGNGAAFKMYGRTEYLKLDKPHTLVYLQQFCDDQGNISRHPFAPTWPETMRVAVTLTSEGPSQTRVTISSEAHGSVTADELQAFIKERGGMTQGWTGSFDKLEDYLQQSHTA